MNMEKIWKNRQNMGPDIAGEIPGATGAALASMDGPSTSMGRPSTSYASCSTHKRKTPRSPSDSEEDEEDEGTPRKNKKVS